MSQMRSELTDQKLIKAINDYRDQYQRTTDEHKKDGLAKQIARLEEEYFDRHGEHLHKRIH
jgi:hypothetical protein